ncbi:hypothetical protein [Paenibacillus dendrobii]|nr:hypothetical protein [Paenibacillus dendrobii]
MDNLILCIKYEVAGFKKNFKFQINDQIYFVIRLEKVTYCVARAKIADTTDRKPWDNSEIYKYAFSLKLMEFCMPFDLSVLAQDFRKWTISYLRDPNSIKEPETIALLEAEFLKHRQNNFSFFGDDQEQMKPENSKRLEQETQITFANQADMNIVGTMSVEEFVGEKDRNEIRGFESIVTEWFYDLFEDYKRDNTILISKNSLFKTSNKDNTNNKIKGTSSKPDAVMVRFTEGMKQPIQISLIEYECYGNITSKSKFNKLTEHIIPQLTRFASAFSVITDNLIRSENIKEFSKKIEDYIKVNERDKIFEWVKKMVPDVQGGYEGQEFHDALLKAFNNNVQIILIIDELTQEQRDTIGNMLKSFKLDNGNYINFVGYVVKLQKVIHLKEGNISVSDYALSIEK